MNTGGSAFPVHPNTNLDLDKRWCGMTLRDYFAAKAMQALINTNYFDTTARIAYEIADAMLKAREA